MILPLLTLALAPALAPESHNQSPFGGEAGQANFNYNYAELGLGMVDPDVSGADTEFGFQLLGSVCAWRDLFVRASYLDVSGDVDSSMLRFGAGWAFPVQEQLDVYGLFSIAQVEVGNDDESGWALEGGARYMVSEQVEINGLLELVDFVDTEFGFGLGGRYNFNENLSAGFNLEIISDFANLYMASIRYAF